MKKLLVGLMVGALILMGCAGLQTKGSNLTAEYYFTTWWGEQSSCQLSENTTYIGRCSKTYRVYPEEDLPWVKEEIRNAELGDKYEISLVWDNADSPVLGVCFDDLTKPLRHDYCGIIQFDSQTGKLMFIQDFEDLGENVMWYIESGMNIPAGQFVHELKKQIKDSEDLVVGEPCDLCAWVERRMTPMEDE